MKRVVKLPIRATRMPTYGNQTANEKGKTRIARFKNKFSDVDSESGFSVKRRSIWAFSRDISKAYTETIWTKEQNRMIVAGIFLTTNMFRQFCSIST